MIDLLTNIENSSHFVSDSENVGFQGVIFNIVYKSYFDVSPYNIPN